MTEQRINTYEGLFLFPHSVTANLQSAVDHVHEILKRAEAEIISFRKWDERRLAYEIKGNKRGVYFLVYFRAPAGNITSIERDSNLSEMLLRTMMTRADHVTAEEIAAADGQQELADEIKSRDEEDAGPSSAPAAVVTTGSASTEEAPAAEAADAPPAKEEEAPAPAGS